MPVFFIFLFPQSKIFGFKTYLKNIEADITVKLKQRDIQVSKHRNTLICISWIVLVRVLCEGGVLVTPAVMATDVPRSHSSAQEAGIQAICILDSRSPISLSLCVENIQAAFVPLS